VKTTLDVRRAESMALPIPFKQLEISEQGALGQSLSATIVDFIQRKGLINKFAWEVGHNTISPNDSVGFLRRNGLEQESLKDDELHFQRLDAEGRMNVTHQTALLLGVVTQ